jgi:threonine aldolase
VNVIDFRSDTVTWPTEAMRAAIAGAEVGDDVYGEDPTVNALESKAAKLLGKEAGLLVASGTMGNLVAILSLTTRGDEAIAGFDTHAITNEGGGLSVLGGVVPRVLPTDDIGRMELSAIDAAVNPDDPHFASSRLILLENSYGARSGAPIPVEYFESIRKIAIQHGLAIHLDGARIFNAAAALQVEAREIAAHVDTVTFCLSKGLCAPIGSMLCGCEEIIHKAHRVRKVLGGGMRQAGIIAAAGIVALEHMVDRLVEDNENAQLLGRGLKEIDGIGIDIESVRTNIIFFEIDREGRSSAQDVANFLRTKHNILVDVAGTNRIRVVTHYWIGTAEIEELVQALEKAILYAGESK